MAACLVLDDGSFNKNTPGMLVALLSQSRASLRKPVSRSSIVMVTLCKISSHIFKTSSATESYWSCNYRNRLCDYRCLSEPGLDVRTINILVIKCHSVVISVGIHVFCIHLISWKELLC
jgi:hypothetical protein